jgi:D-beta-D-heptose 7-phosphate kinase/D-beta-D-heptose 1-phosphate adenosyltransferase
MSRSANRQAQQIFRVDREERSPIDPNVERRLIDAILPQLPSHAAVLISDYAKGACTPALLAKVIEAARQRAIPVLIDPARIDDYAHYRHATLLAPNRVEAEMVTGRKIRSSNDALIAAESLSKRWEVPVVVIKLDCDGMVVAANGSPGRYCPTKHRVVQDVTGAGDMVLAMIGLAHASGLGWDEALVLANEAAGLEVERLGVSPVSKTELKTAIVPGAPAQPKQVTNDEMTHLVRTYRGQGKKIVFTNGCFDLLHVGHVGYLQEAASLGDVLIVAVNSDVSVRRLKGDGRPVVKELDRAAMIASLGCVDHVLIFDEDTPHRLLSQLRPDVLVKGGTYKCADVIGREVVESYGGDVKVLRLVQGISTTKIIDEIKIHQATSA